MDFGDDHYDYFNAPQYVDFNELVHGNSSHDDEVDKYFETHREEHDFLPVCTSPNTGFQSTVIPAQFDVVYDVEAYYNNKKFDEDAAPVSPCTSAHPEGEQQEFVVREEERVVPDNCSVLEEVRQPNNHTTTPPVAAYITVETGTTDDVDKDVIMPEQKEATEKEVSIKVEVEYPEVDEDIADSMEHHEENAGTKTELHDHVEDSVAKTEHTEEHEPSVESSLYNEVKIESASVGELPQVPIVSNCVVADASKLTLAKPSYSSSSLPREFSRLHAAIKKPATKITVPQPFKFSETRPRVHKIQEPQNDAPQFKAKHAPLRAMQGDSAIRVSNPPRTTQPIGFHFASDERIRQRQANRKSIPVAPVEQPKFNFNSLPRQGRSSFRSVRSVSREKLSSSISSEQQNPGRCRSRSSSREVIKTPTPTQIKPFSFDERDKECQLRKQHKIMKAIEAESKVKEFHAQPVPNFTATLKKLPIRKAPEITHPEPFKLKCDVRGAHYQEILTKKLEEEDRHKREQTTFQALPNEVIYKKPFEPAKSTIPIPEPVDPGLSTDRRAEERARFDEMIKQKEQQLEELKQKEKVLHELQEDKLAQEMRKMCVHKAKPAPRYRFFEVRNSAKPLTDPNSPAFQPLPSQRRGRESNKENFH